MRAQGEIDVHFTDRAACLRVVAVEGWKWALPSRTTVTWVFEYIHRHDILPAQTLDYIVFWMVEGKMMYIQSSRLLGDCGHCSATIVIIFLYEQVLGATHIPESPHAVLLKKPC